MVKSLKRRTPQAAPSPRQLAEKSSASLPAVVHNSLPDWSNTIEKSPEFLEGYDASRRGQIRSRNPYGYGTTSYEYWSDGWHAFFWGDRD